MFPTSFFGPETNLEKKFPFHLLSFNFVKALKSIRRAFMKILHNFEGFSIV